MNQGDFFLHFFHYFNTISEFRKPLEFDNAPEFIKQLQFITVPDINTDAPERNELMKLLMRLKNGKSSIYIPVEFFKYAVEFDEFITMMHKLTISADST